jgi:hypothetical protein
MKSVEAVRIELQYSRAGVAILAGMALASFAIVLLTPMRHTLRAASSFALAMLALEALQRVVLLRSPGAVRRFRVQRGGRIEVECVSGARVAGIVRPGSFVAPWLTIVRWRRPGARVDSTVLVLPDMAPAEPLRRLRVLLRWAPGDS